MLGAMSLDEYETFNAELCELIEQVAGTDGDASQEALDRLLGFGERARPVVPTLLHLVRTGISEKRCQQELRSILQTCSRLDPVQGNRINFGPSDF